MSRAIEVPVEVRQVAKDAIERWEGDFMSRPCDRLECNSSEYGVPGRFGQRGHVSWVRWCTSCIEKHSNRELFTTIDGDHGEFQPIVVGEQVIFRAGD